MIFEDGNETEEAPYTRGRLKACANAWRGIDANELDMSWINGDLTNFTLKSATNQKIKIRLNDNVVEQQLKAREIMSFDKSIILK